MNFIQIIEPFFISAIVAYLITPFIRIIAVRLNYLDHPRDNKIHAHPTPLLGGVAIFLAFGIAILSKDRLILTPIIRACLSGTVILLIIGLIDDKMGMMPSFKLLGQFLAAMIIIKAGLRIVFIENYYLSVIVTYLWIIGITNAFNLLDNMNGLSAGIAVISASSFGIISYVNGQLPVSWISFALAGSALGFLRHNFPKAGIFMGDSGSLILGYILSAIALMGSWKTPVLTVSIMIPAIILGYPIFDTALVFIMRMIEGRSVFRGGKDHSSHRLALLGLKRNRTVLIIYGICLLLGTIAFTITKVDKTSAIVLMACTFIVMMALGIRLSFIDTKRFGRKKGANAQNA